MLMPVADDKQENPSNSEFINLNNIFIHFPPAVAITVQYSQS